MNEMGIIIMYLVFALLIGAMGIYLLTHRQGFLNLSASQARMPATFFGWFFTLDALALIVSVVLRGSEPLPAGIFVILATILTTVLAVVVTSRLFK
ncbi:hypothetical protein ACAW68_08600 [Weissella confusa]|uniref:hypothetical protein n=1 Tax=Weissella confusa TaxID=1583 RepID=UPI0035A35985